MIRSSLLVRRALLGLGVAALVFTASSCSAGRPPAASVEGEEITAETVFADVEAEAEAAAAGDPASVNPASPFADPLGAGAETLSTDSTAFALTGRINYLLFGEELRRRDIEVTEAHREQARSSLCADPATGQAAADGSCPALDDYPAAYRNFQLELQARQVALGSLLQGEDPDAEAKAKALFDEQVAAGTVPEVACLEVAAVAAEGDVATVQAAVEGGQSFADAVTAAGGQVQGVQCIDATQIAAELASAEPGDVLGPFGGESGIVVVQLQETRPGEYDDLAEALLAQVNQQFSEVARTELLDSLGAIDVSVDPRFGTWQPDQLTVAAPQGPSTPPSTTLPTP